MYQIAASTPLLSQHVNAVKVVVKDFPSLSSRPLSHNSLACGARACCVLSVFRSRSCFASIRMAGVNARTFLDKNLNRKQFPCFLYVYILKQSSLACSSRLCTCTRALKPPKLSEMCGQGLWLYKGWQF